MWKTRVFFTRVPGEYAPVSTRWFIVHAGKEQGPYTAEELRTAVRRGDVDPFDVIFQEGSAVRRVLIDVDAVFDSDSSAVYQFAEVAPLAFPYVTNPEPTKISRPVSDASRLPDANGRGAASPMVDKDARRYMVHTPFRGEQGPYRAREVAKLFRNGKIARGAKVSKDGTGARVPVSKFVGRYEGSRGPGEASGESSSPQSSITRTVRQAKALTAPRLRRAAKFSTSKVPAISLLFVLWGFLVGAWALSSFGVGKTLGDAWGELKHWMVTDEPVPAAQTNPRTVAPSPRVIAPTPAAVAPPAVSEPARASTAAVRPSEILSAPSPAAASPPKRPPLKIKRRDDPDIETQRPRSPPLQDPQFEENRRPFDRGGFSPPVASPPISGRVQPPPADIPSRTQVFTRSPGAGVRGASKSLVAQGPSPYKEGQVASISGARYDLGALKACPLKCRLTFTDSAGRSMTGVFFKGAFESQLKAGKGRVSIRGMIKKEGGGLVIFLQQ